MGFGKSFGNFLGATLGVTTGLAISNAVYGPQFGPFGPFAMGPCFPSPGDLYGFDRGFGGRDFAMGRMYQREIDRGREEMAFMQGRAYQRELDRNVLAYGGNYWGVAQLDRTYV